MGPPYSARGAGETLPKIQASGFPGQMQPAVLLSMFGDIAGGQLNTFGKSRRQRSTRQRSVATGTVSLPETPRRPGNGSSSTLSLAYSVSPSSKSLGSALLSARSLASSSAYDVPAPPEEGRAPTPKANSLRAKIYKEDQVKRLRANSPDEPEELLLPDSERPDTGLVDWLKGPNALSQFADEGYGWSQAKGKSTISEEETVLFPPLPKREPKETRRLRRQRSERLEAPAVDEEARLRALRESFQISESTVQAALAELEALPVGGSLESEPVEVEGLEGFKLSYESSGLEDLPIRGFGVTANPSRMGFNQSLPHPQSWQTSELEDKAGKAELDQGAAMLNFIRRQCGLGELRLGANLNFMADVISKALMLRQPDKGHEGGSGRRQLNTGFAEVLTSFLAPKTDQIGILHLENCLPAAIVQMMTAVHALPQLPPPVPLASSSSPSPRRQRPGQTEVSPRQSMRASDMRPLSTVALASLKPFLELTSVQSQEHGPQVGPGLPCRLDTVKADERGALTLRRCLLDPSLQFFGAARIRDACTLWIGKETKDTLDEDDDELPPPAPHVPRPEAVSFPPAGWVPTWMLAGWRTPWTIMPDSTRFQPTSTIKVQIWRVKIRRNGSNETGAERLYEVPVKGLTVDCSLKGEPFCVIFWPGPGAGRASSDGRVQLELCLSGLRGPKTELTFFYEVALFRQQILDQKLLKEVANWNALFQPQNAGPGRDAVDLWGGSAASQKVQEKVEDWKPKARDQPPFLPRPPPPKKEVPLKFSGAYSIEPVSHKNLNIQVSSVDLVMTVKVEGIQAIRAELLVTRFGGFADRVPRATQVVTLDGGFCLIRVKLPVPRVTYELRIGADDLMVDAEERGARAAEEAFEGLVYTITTEVGLVGLFASFEDPITKKFGFCQMSANAQMFGVRILAPSLFRVTLGRCHFLVQLDKAAALAQAEREIKRGKGGGGKETVEGLQPVSWESKVPLAWPTSILFSERLLPAAPSEPIQPHAQHQRRNSDPQLRNPCKDLHTRLRPILEPVTQDAEGSFQLDIALRNGHCIARLRERPDLPGFFEGLVSLAEMDVLTPVRLFLRLPRRDSGAYFPRLIAEWLVCRSERVPAGF